MQFDDESQSNRRPTQQIHKKPSEEGLSDSQTKIYTSSEDFEANTNSEIDWVVNLDQSKELSGDRENSKRVNTKAIEEKDEEIEESIKSEVEDYGDDFEDPSRGSGSNEIEKKSMKQNLKKENMNIEIKAITADEADLLITETIRKELPELLEEGKQELKKEEEEQKKMEEEKR